MNEILHPRLTGEQIKIGNKRVADGLADTVAYFLNTRITAALSDPKVDVGYQVLQRGSIVGKEIDPDTGAEQDVEGEVERLPADWNEIQRIVDEIPKINDDERYVLMEAIRAYSSAIRGQCVLADWTIADIDEALTWVSKVNEIREKEERGAVKQSTAVSSEPESRLERKAVKLYRQLRPVVDTLYAHFFDEFRLASVAPSYNEEAIKAKLMSAGKKRGLEEEEAQNIVDAVLDYMYELDYLEGPEPEFDEYADTPKEVVQKLHRLTNVLSFALPKVSAPGFRRAYWGRHNK
jgi:hypothetical protein